MQIFAQTVPVVCNQGIGRFKNIAMRTVILLQPDQVLYIEILLERQHIADICPTESVNALVVITYRENGRIIPRQKLQPFVLQIICVLKLIHQNMPETILIMFPQGLVPFQKLVTSEQQLGEIDDTFPLALVLVKTVQLDHLAFVVILWLDMRCTIAAFLRVIDEINQIARRVFVVVDIVRLQKALDGR